MRLCYTGAHDRAGLDSRVASARSGGPLRLLLDVIEPLGVPGAQLLWVAQPLFGLFGAAAVAGRLAALLQEPDGIARLREMLESDC